MTRRLKGERFASVYERFLYSDLSDRAVRLLLVLDRHADDSGGSFPQRPRLAELLRCSVDTIDRLVAEAVAAGAITVEKAPRPGGGQPLSVFYLWPASPEQSRTHAAMQSRTDAAVKAAPVRLSKPQTGGTAPSIEREPMNENKNPVAAPQPTFDDFWRVYPRKTGKGAARAAWEKATRKAEPRTIANAAWRYARDPNLPEEQFIPLPSTWLNQERWEDGPLPARGSGPRRPAQNVDQDRGGPTGRVAAP